jgi:ribosomal-protein-alanine N-acetyltransferase
MIDVNFNPFPLITTERLVLRPIREKDAGELLFLRSDEDIMKYIQRPRTKTREDVLQLIARITELERNNEGINWAITLKEENILLGTICLFNIVKEHHRAELGYLLHPAYHGKGVMQEAVTPVLRYGFNDMQLHTIEANVDPGNIASIKLLEKNKFNREAYFRENFLYEGKFLDTAVYSLINPY